MKPFTIIGKVVYEDIEGGFWGIQGDDGQQWLPASMPSSLKKAGLRVRVIARESDSISMRMWGTPIRIVSFKILSS